MTPKEKLLLQNFIYPLNDQQLQLHKYQGLFQEGDNSNHIQCPVKRDSSTLIFSSEEKELNSKRKKRTRSRKGSQSILEKQNHKSGHIGFPESLSSFVLTSSGHLLEPGSNSQSGSCASQSSAASTVVDFADKAYAESSISAQGFIASTSDVKPERTLGLAELVKVIDMNKKNSVKVSTGRLGNDLRIQSTILEGDEDRNRTAAGEDGDIKLPKLAKENMDFWESIENLPHSVQIKASKETKCLYIMTKLNEVLRERHAMTKSLSFWKSVTDRFFSPKTTLSYVLNISGTNKWRTFTMAGPTIPLHYKLFHDNEVETFFCYGFICEYSLTPHLALFESRECVWDFAFGKSGGNEREMADCRGGLARLRGRLRVLLQFSEVDSEFKIVSFQFVSKEFTEFENVKCSRDGKKCEGGSMVNQYGIPDFFLDFLEMCETFECMGDLIEASMFTKFPPEECMVFFAPK
eukprot:Nk52_evm1s1159 gene=Nk52_evmTU1s1159